MKFFVSSRRQLFTKIGGMSTTNALTANCARHKEIHGSKSDFAFAACVALPSGILKLGECPHCSLLDYGSV